MRKKILERLQAKKAGSLKKLSQKGIEILLDKIEPKVQSEDDIDSTIDDLDKGPIAFDDFVELLQKESDRKSRAVRTALEKDFDFVKKKKDDDDDDEPGDTTKAGQQPDVSQLVADAVSKALAPFAALAGNMRTEQTKTTLKAALKGKNIPEDWADDVVFSEGYSEEDTLSRLETKWNNAKQLAINEAVGNGSVLKGNNSPTSFAETSKKFGEQTDLKKEGYNIQSV